MEDIDLFICEDEPDMAELIQEILQEEGYTVKCFHNADDALASLHSFHPYAILSDIKMPGKSGLDFLREIRIRGVATPLVIVSAFGDKDYILEAMRLGAIDFLEKPVDGKVLAGVAGRAIEIGRCMKKLWGRGDETFRVVESQTHKKLGQLLAYNNLQRKAA